MQFEMPDIQNKTISVSTLKIYKAQLNKLARLGYDNITILQEKPDIIVEEITKLLEGQNNFRHRLMYCAIFYVLADTEYTKTTNPYHKDFSNYKDAETQDNPYKKH